MREASENQRGTCEVRVNRVTEPREREKPESEREKREGVREKRGRAREKPERNE